VKKFQKKSIYTRIGFFSPYINLYDELTGRENLDFFYDLKVANKNEKPEKIKFLLEKSRPI